MTGHDWLVLSHVLAAIVWIGGATIARVMEQHFIPSGDGGQVAGFAQIIQWTGLGVYEPVSPLVTEIDA